jgi:hypothetical protein
VWLLIAIGWHALVDALSVYLVSTQSIYTVEAAIGVMALVSLGVIFILRSPDPVSAVEETPPVQPALPDPAIENSETVDSYRLDETRYQ